MILLNENLIDLKEEGKDNVEVLNDCVDLMVKEDVVEETYRQQVISREKECPTALQFENIIVALAHGDPIGVKKSAMVIARCENHPGFGLMDNPEKFVPVDVVILLAVNDPNGHIQVLARLIEALSKKEVCDHLKQSNDKKQLCELLENELLKEKTEDEQYA